MVGSRGIPTGYSGIETALAELCPRLVERGHQVTVYCRKSYSLPASYRGVKLVSLPSLGTKHLDTISHVSLSVAHLLLRESVDIVHFHALGPSLLSWIPRLGGKGVVVTVQGQDWRREKWGPLARAVLRIGESASAQIPHQVIVVSRTLKRQYQETYGTPVNYIPNGVAVRPPRPPKQITSLYGLRGDDYILFAGRLVPEKGCHYLLEAFRKMSVADTTNIKLVMAGEGLHTHQYVEDLKRHAGTEVMFVGHVSGEILEELLSNAALCVLPSTVEGLSLSLLEAMAFSRCVVVSDIPENREVIGEAGLVFRNRDAADLERVIRGGLAQSERRRELGRRARELVMQKYDWEILTRETEAVYRALVAKER
jgi:glycosyltransferase involved in cell wall biosynthesis